MNFSRGVKMKRRDREHNLQQGYFDGASGRRSQFDFDDSGFDGRGGQMSYGDDANWKNDRTTPHYNMDYFGMGTRSRGFNKHLDNYPHEGNFEGLGPKAYRRSDERTFEDVCEALKRSDLVDASEIDVQVKEGIVTLSGVVESKRMKRLAEREIEYLPGVEDVMNLLRPRGEAVS
jgi:hypothetical protein